MKILLVEYLHFGVINVIKTWKWCLCTHTVSPEAHDDHRQPVLCHQSDSVVVLPVLVHKQFNSQVKLYVPSIKSTLASWPDPRPKKNIVATTEK